MISRGYLHFLFIFSVKEKQTYFFPRHFSLILLSSARLVGIIFGVNIVCTRKWFIMSF